MENISNEQWNSVVSELTVVREAFASLVYTLASAGHLKLDEFNTQVALTAGELETADPSIAEALREFGDVLANNAEMAHLQLAVSAARKKRGG